MKDFDPKKYPNVKHNISDCYQSKNKQEYFTTEKYIYSMPEILTEEAFTRFNKFQTISSCYMDQELDPQSLDVVAVTSPTVVIDIQNNNNPNKSSS
jgi:hypothetical protein